MDYSVGRFAVVKGWDSIDCDSDLRPDVFRIDAETPKTIKKQRRGIMGGLLDSYDVKPKSQVLVTFGDETAAQQFVQAINGIRGEMDRRKNAAREWAAKALKAKIAALTPADAV